MDKSIKKLMLAAVSLVMAAVMVITISYAWMTLSTSPIAEGIQISIGGGNVILIAADQSETVDGVEYHYPSKFQSTLHFDRMPSYSYLQGLGELSPVSTADGVHWFIPEYYDLGDSALVSGDAVAGQMKPIEQFTLDTSLDYANLTAAEQSERGRGGYIYLDFWVVSPGTDYQLRISQGDENGGSYLIELQEPEAVDTDGDGENDSYTLYDTAGYAAASARVGFLVNSDQVTDASMQYYQKSVGYDSRYTRLSGIFHEPDEMTWYSSDYRFTIYEPNGDLHPAGVGGGYNVTRPLAWESGVGITQQDIGDRLTVQLQNTWKMQTEAGVPLDEQLSTAVFGKTFGSADEVQDAFYNDYLQNQLMPYVNKGKFIQNTASLYAGADEDGFVKSEVVSALAQAGATDDTCIVSLEKNVPQRIRMFVWLEGQDIDCINPLGGIDLALSIELAGSKIDENGQTSEEQENTEPNIAGIGLSDPGRGSLYLPVRHGTGAWEGLCNLWQVQLLPSRDGKYGADDFGRRTDYV